VQGLDTNVLVRFLLRDEPGQARAAKAAIDRPVASGDPVLISLLTILETEWVLRTRAHLDKVQIVATFEQLLEASDVLFENEAVLETALFAFENSNADFADCLMVAQYQHLGCSRMLTFDGRAAKLPGGKLLR
jgi:predicted nucleic-acid-binding protein